MHWYVLVQLPPVISAQLPWFFCSVRFAILRSMNILVIQRVDPLLGNDLETNNETSATTQRILNKQVYAAVTG
jgi:hypothetical protein